MVRSHPSTHIGVHTSGARFGMAWHLYALLLSRSRLLASCNHIPSASFSQIYNERYEFHHIYFSVQPFGVQFMLPAVLLTAATGNLCCREMESNASCNTINKQKCKSRNTQEDLTLPPWTCCHKNDGIKFIHQFQFVIGEMSRSLLLFYHADKVNIDHYRQG